jgi:gephyrin
MLPVEEALAAVLSAAAARAAVSAVPLLDALGLVLAEDARAPDPLPPFRASVKVGQPLFPLPAPPTWPALNGRRRPTPAGWVRRGGL